LPKKKYIGVFGWESVTVTVINPIFPKGSWHIQADIAGRREDGAQGTL
jgi:hypothetical protein